MKTFKLCSLAVLFDEEHNDKGQINGQHVPLVDGLIINKEEADKNWLLDAVVTREWKDFFQEYLDGQEKFMAEVTITKKTNDPATLVCQVTGINDIGKNLSIHLDGILVVKKDDLSDMLLKNLLKEGYSGDELYDEFKRRKKDRGKAIQGILTNAYEQVKQKGYYNSES
ncbi:YwpF-like family protein [Evansella clarkii]|jgi:hypothetical protein|uniref:YwpF-like family protein n=1 Tax=Evansella clarkii TaxID=79879 RepID=UPI0009987A93|nr:YwpF-like family protein [Evansella clarkii]